MIPLAATSTIRLLRAGVSELGDYDELQLARQDFEGETENEVKSAVEWVAIQYTRVDSALRREFGPSDTERGERA